MTSKLILIAIAGTLAVGQTTPAPKPAASKPAATKPAPAASSRVDEVIQAVKAGLSEPDIIDSLRQTNKAIPLTLADRTKLKQAGVSDGIVKVMLDPTAAAAAPAAPA